MKKAAFLTLGINWITAITLLAAGTRIAAKTWHDVQTYNVRALSQNLKSHTRELVAVKFSFRGKDIHHLKPNWYEGSIWQPGPQGKRGFANVRVMIANKDLSAFKTITTDASSSTEMTAYGRVLWDSENNFTFVRLLGRKAVADPSGNAVISW